MVLGNKEVVMPCWDKSIFAVERGRKEKAILSMEQWVSSLRNEVCVSHCASLNSQRCYFSFRFKQAGLIWLQCVANAMCVCLLQSPHPSLHPERIWLCNVFYSCTSWACTSQWQSVLPLLWHAELGQPSQHPWKSQAAAQQSATEGTRVDYSKKWWKLRHIFLANFPNE